MYSVTGCVDGGEWARGDLCVVPMCGIGCKGADVDCTSGMRGAGLRSDGSAVGRGRVGCSEIMREHVRNL